MKAWQLLDSKEKWTCHTNARASNGKSVPIFDENACQWCALGAIAFCYREKVLEMATIVEKHLGRELTFFNDNSSYETVYAVLQNLDI
jgi:hypothetical protein